MLINYEKMHILFQFLTFWYTYQSITLLQEEQALPLTVVDMFTYMERKQKSRDRPHSQLSSHFHYLILSGLIFRGNYEKTSESRNIEKQNLKKKTTSRDGKVLFSGIGSSTIEWLPRINCFPDESEVNF